MASDYFSQYVSLPNSAKQPLPGAQESGTLDPNEPMQVSIYVRPKSANPLPATPTTPMSREEYASTYGADPADIAQIVAFAQAHGLTVRANRSHASRRGPGRHGGNDDECFQGRSPSL